jgi:glycosyltransferase involved in cell wall biosynthesis
VKCSIYNDGIALLNLVKERASKMADEISNGLTGPKRLRILALIPLVYGDDYGFWNRDLGLVVRTLRSMGHDAWLMALYDPGQTLGPDKPVIRATMKELEDPAWWQKQQPDALIIGTWSATRFEAIRTAALSLKKPLIEKLDTDGVKSPKIWFSRYLLRDAVNYNYSDPWHRKAKAFLKAVSRTVVVFAFPGLLDKKMVKGMSRVAVFAAETPLAVARVKRFLRLFGAAPMPRVVTISHPVNTSQMRLLPGDLKENIVVAVGRWDDAVKGWPLLVEVARRFLAIRPDWKMVVIGGLPRFSAKVRKEILSLQDCLLLTGPLEHQQLSEWNRRAKIYLLTSHCETFNIAAAEALCCGCSVVGPSQIASASYFAGCQSGTPSYLRTPDHMTDALVAEADEWEGGKRDPVKISQASLQKFEAETVAKCYLKIFEEMEGAASKPSSG